MNLKIYTVIIISLCLVSVSCLRSEDDKIFKIPREYKYIKIPESNYEIKLPVINQIEPSFTRINEFEYNYKAGSISSIWRGFTSGDETISVLRVTLSLNSFKHLIEQINRNWENKPLPVLQEERDAKVPRPFLKDLQPREPFIWTLKEEVWGSKYRYYIFPVEEEKTLLIYTVSKIKSPELVEHGDQVFEDIYKSIRKVD